MEGHAAACFLPHCGFTHLSYLPRPWRHLRLQCGFTVRLQTLASFPQYSALFERDTYFLYFFLAPIISFLSKRIFLLLTQLIHKSLLCTSYVLNDILVSENKGERGRLVPPLMNLSD